MEVSIGFLIHRGIHEGRCSMLTIPAVGGSRLSRALGGLALLAEAVPSREGLSKSMLRG